MEINYYQKYLKYKSKYLRMKEIIEGGALTKKPQTHEKELNKKKLNIISVIDHNGNKKYFNVYISTNTRGGRFISDSIDFQEMSYVDNQFSKTIDGYYTEFYITINNNKTIIIIDINEANIPHEPKPKNDTQWIQYYLYGTYTFDEHYKLINHKQNKQK